jgi:hypothetical protein
MKNNTSQCVNPCLNSAFQIIVESFENQVPVRRAELATRKPKRSPSSRKSREPSESSQKDGSNRIQVTALVEGRRQLMAEESTIG